MVEPAERASDVNGNQWEVQNPDIELVLFREKPPNHCRLSPGSAGSVNPFASDPGAYAPGFMLSRALRASSYAV